MPPWSVLKLPLPRASGATFWPTTWYVRMLDSVFLSASTLLRVFFGILANASLSGANTVMFCAELRVSTRPAFLTAVTSVDRTGLLEAAVATGSADMPEKLPLPLLGTAEQAAPNGLSE